MPYRKNFLASLKKDPSVSDDQLYEDMRTAMVAGKTHIEEINRFFTEKGQHSDAVVWAMASSSEHSANFTFMKGNAKKAAIFNTMCIFSL